MRILATFSSRRLLSVLAAAAAICAPSAGSAAACSARSGSETTALVELYTSEGCDSCPPADRWLMSSFKPGAPGAKAVALAFHVDYWDRLGWKDRFATKASSSTVTAGAAWSSRPKRHDDAPSVTEATRARETQRDKHRTSMDFPSSMAHLPRHA